MAGLTLRYAREKKKRDDPTSKRGRFLDKVIKSKFMRYFLGPTAASFIALGGININNIGGNQAMAAPGTRRLGVEEIDKKTIKQDAVDAATAFGAYVARGNDSDRDKYLKIYDGYQKNPKPDEKELFMETFDAELEKIVKSSDIKPYWDAFVEDRKLVEPAVKLDFIDTVYSIRSALKRDVKFPIIYAKFGEKLTVIVAANYPKEQARKAVDYPSA